MSADDPPLTTFVMGTGGRPHGRIGDYGTGLPTFTSIHRCRSEPSSVGAHLDVQCRLSWTSSITPR